MDGVTNLKDDLTITPPLSVGRTPALKITRGSLQLDNGDVSVKNGNVDIESAAGIAGTGRGQLNAEGINVANGDVDISNGDLTVSGSGVGNALTVNGMVRHTFNS